MKNFAIGQEVQVPSGRIGVLKSTTGQQAIVWFDAQGNDTGYFSLATLNYPSKPVLVVKG